MSDGVRDLAERVKQANDIVEVAQGYFPTRPRGIRSWALCPFHREKSPSFTLHHDDQFFHCFGCGKSGDVITLVMELDHLSFWEAVKVLARRGGVPLPERPRDAGEDKRLRLFGLARSAAEYYVGCLSGGGGRRARAYLDQRGMSPEVREVFGVGYAPDGWRNLLETLRGKGFRDEEILRVGLVRQKEDGGHPYDLLRDRVVIPIRDPSGRVIAFGGRSLEAGPDPRSPKYLNSPETDLFSKRAVLFGFDRARDAARAAGSFLVMEGYMDVIAAHQRGLTNAVGVLGTALTRDHAHQMLRYAQRAVLLFDADEGGARAADRGAPILLSEGLEVVVVSLPDGQDPDDFLRTHDVETFQELIRTSAEDLVSFLSRRARDRHGEAGVATGAAAVRDVLQAVGAIRDPLRRDLFLRRVSQEFGVDERLVRREAARLFGAAVAEAEAPGPVRPARPRLRAAELDEVFLLRGLVFQPSLAARATESLFEADFRDPVRRRIFACFKERRAAGEDVGISALQLALREDAPAHDELQAILGREIPSGDSAEQALTRIVARRDETAYQAARDEARRDGVLKDSESDDLDERLRELQRYHQDRYSRSKDSRRSAESGDNL